MEAKKTNQENSELEVFAFNRNLNEALKRKLIDELDKKVITIGQIVVLYGVSRTTVYKWRYLYSVHYQKQTKVVIQMESELQGSFLNQRVAIRACDWSKQLNSYRIRLDLSSEKYGEHKKCGLHLEWFGKHIPLTTNH